MLASVNPHISWSLGSGQALCAGRLCFLLCMLSDASFHTCPFSQSPCAAADAVFGKEVWTDVGRIGLPWCWGHHFPATVGKLWPLYWDNLTFPMIFFLSSPTFCPFLRLHRAYLRSGDVDIWSQIVFEQGRSRLNVSLTDVVPAGKKCLLVAWGHNVVHSLLPFLRDRLDILFPKYICNIFIL